MEVKNNTKKHSKDSIVIRVRIDEKHLEKLRLIQALQGISSTQLFSEAIAKKIDEVFDDNREIICKIIDNCSPQ